MADLTYQEAVLAVVSWCGMCRDAGRFYHFPEPGCERYIRLVEVSDAYPRSMATYLHRAALHSVVPQDVQLAIVTEAQWAASLAEGTDPYQEIMPCPMTVRPKER